MDKKTRFTIPAKPLQSSVLCFGAIFSYIFLYLVIFIEPLKISKLNTGHTITLATSKGVQE